MTRNMWAAMVTLALTTAPALAQERAPIADQEVHAAVAAMDRTLGEKIAKQVRRYVHYTIFDDINIGVHDGVATLTGRVTMPYKAKDLGRIVAKVEGVREVQNNLEVLPVSIHDDRLRRSIARQIYRDPVFSRYAIHVNPPIHIVVERGNVTLTGAVNSRVEFQKAESIARSTFGVFNVDNRLKIDS